MYSNRKIGMKDEEIVMEKDNKPTIQLTPYTKELPPRQGGQLNGLFHMPEDFDSPLPQEWLDLFYGKEDK